MKASDDFVLEVVSMSWTMKEAAAKLEVDTAWLRRRLDRIRLRHQRYANLLSARDNPGKIRHLGKSEN